MKKIVFKIGSLFVMLIIGFIAWIIWLWLTPDYKTSVINDSDTSTYVQQFEHERDKQLLFVDVNCDSLVSFLTSGSRGIDASSKPKYFGHWGNKKLTITIPEAPDELIRVCTEEALPVMEDFDCSDCKISIDDGRVIINADSYSENGSYFVRFPVTLLSSIFEWADKAPIYHK